MLTDGVSSKIVLKLIILWCEKMKVAGKTWKELLSDGLLVFFFFGTIGIALKFVTFFNHWVYFPSFPDALDSAFLILGSTYFFSWIMYKKFKGQNAETKKCD